MFGRDDHDESFLAESDVDEGSLSNGIRARRENVLNFYHPGRATCAARVAGFKAVAWAMPKDPSVGSTWDEMSEGPLAEAVFQRGNVYIAAILAPSGPQCAHASWAATTDISLRIEEAQSADALAQPDGIRREPPVPYLTEWKADYTHFRATSGTKKLPDSWQSLEATSRVWTFSSQALTELRIVNFKRSVTPELLGRPNEPGKPWFSRSGVAVWRLARGGVEFRGPDQSLLDDSESLLAVAAVLVEGGNALLSLTSSRHFSTLRRVGSRYEVAEELSTAPAP